MLCIIGGQLVPDIFSVGVAFFVPHIVHRIVIGHVVLFVKGTQIQGFRFFVLYIIPGLGHQDLGAVHRLFHDGLFPHLIGVGATKLRDYTIALYKKCAEYALSRGIIIADTKFEFGLDEDGNVILGDEMLTPDSSRFWPLEGYEAGHGQPSFDKQFVRNWLLANPDSDYDLPQDVIDKTIAKYEEAYEMLTGKKL